MGEDDAIVVCELNFNWLSNQRLKGWLGEDDAIVEIPTGEGQLRPLRKVKREDIRSAGDMPRLPGCSRRFRGRTCRFRPRALPGSFRPSYRSPRERVGASCRICGNRCQIGGEDLGYCGLRRNREGKLQHLAGTSQKGLLEYYYDPLPTNCVADWVCAGSRRRGEKNLAVFMGACTFDCLFCQNIQYRLLTISPQLAISPQSLAEAVREDTACICFFGGDPAPQLPFALKASELALERDPGKRLHICWETNGSMHRGLLKKAVELSLASGGCIKFDLKALDKKLHLALCGVSNQTTLENFSFVSSLTDRRREPPLLVASTLLVPGYVEAEEVGKIARFIASLDPEIPYSLLAFYPCHLMKDMPVTTRRQAEECLGAALQAGLKKVHLGNIHLLR